MKALNVAENQVADGLGDIKTGLSTKQEATELVGRLGDYAEFLGLVLSSDLMDSQGQPSELAKRGVVNGIVDSYSRCRRRQDKEMTTESVVEKGKEYIGRNKILNALGSSALTGGALLLVNSGLDMASASVTTRTVGNAVAFGIRPALNIMKGFVTSRAKKVSSGFEDDIQAYAPDKDNPNTTEGAAGDIDNLRKKLIEFAFDKYIGDEAFTPEMVTEAIGIMTRSVLDEAVKSSWTDAGKDFLKSAYKEGMPDLLVALGVNRDIAKKITGIVV